MKIRVAVGVTLAWLIIATILGSQAALGMNLQGNPVVLGVQVRTQLINSLPWIPGTLLAIALAVRYPVTRTRWKRTLWVHLAAIPVIAFIANVGVVLGFWWVNGVFNGFRALVDSALLWAAIRIHVAVGVYGVTVVLTQAWIYAQEARERELKVARLQAQFAQARFQALNQQIRPHFLFNTLHTIGQLWRSGRSDDADAMLDHLGSLFHRVRRSTDRGGIPLAEELSMVEDYLSIERVRFSDRLEASIEADSDARSCVIPPLLLQPLVENAIRHGVSASPGAGRVAVRARVEGERLTVEVEDDGPGMDHPSSQPGSGTGLSNTRERLDHVFGDAQRMEIGSRNGAGTLVRLELPAIRDEDALLAPRSVSHG